jgi:hypothetical protein
MAEEKKDHDKKPEKKHLHRHVIEETDDGHFLHHQTYKKKRGDTETEPERKNTAVSMTADEAGQHAGEQMGMNEPPPAPAAPPDASAAPAAGADPTAGGGVMPGQ